MSSFMLVVSICTHLTGQAVVCNEAYVARKPNGDVAEFEGPSCDVARLDHLNVMRNALRTLNQPVPKAINSQINRSATMTVRVSCEPMGDT